MDINKDSEILKAIGHPVRLEILKCLMQETCKCNVNRIVEVLKIPQSTISQHLGILRNKGIIKPEKNGVKTCYRITDERIIKIMQIL
jgi:DNA-binding transcriptional ArsR family regulator